MSSPTKKFYLFGTPISKSLSPSLHNAGFKHYNLNCEYNLCDTGDINQVVEKIKESDTWGGSVTIPHKQTIIPFVDKLTEAAKKIGAVNTLTKENDGKELVGDNTDYIAIYRLSKKQLEILHPETPLSELQGLIVGAGGTAHAACYALSQLGLKFYIWNRTAEKANELAKEFGGKAITDLNELKEGSIDLVVGTVPPTAQFSLPDHLLKPKLVVVELVYHPRNTALVTQAKNIGCVVVEGSELLFEQGIEQFRKFSGKEPPCKEIAFAMVNSANGEHLKEDLPKTFAEYLKDRCILPNYE